MEEKGELGLPQVRWEFRQKFHHLTSPKLWRFPRSWSPLLLAQGPSDRETESVCVGTILRNVTYVVIFWRRFVLHQKEPAFGGDSLRHHKPINHHN